MVKAPTEVEISAAAVAMMHFMFAPHEMPLPKDLREKYMACAKAALEAAATVSV